MEPDVKLDVEDPWVCPNDRELSLRARLDSGWSFYTNRQHGGKKFLIKKEEVSKIEGIIKKAEEVTLREEFRIGRLVDRLENIKNNAQGNGITTCLLCDEKFGKITATPMKCSICEKVACAKCGVDTMSSGNMPIFLCKLCNEQREFWKKSGAWFFRQLPKHELPPARERHYLTSGSFIVSTPELKSKKGNLLSQASELYSDSDVESEPSSEEIIDDPIQSRSIRRRKYPGRVDRKDKPQRNDSIQEKLQRHEYGDGHMGSSDQLDGYSSRHSSILTVDDDASLSRSETSSPLISKHRSSSRLSAQEKSDDEQESKNSKILRHSPLLVRKNKRPSIGKSANGALNEDNVTFGETRRQSFYNEDIKSVLYEEGDSTTELKGPLGVIEFTVNYVKENSRLDVHIHNAKGLPAMDSTGLSDPYVKVHLLPWAGKGNKTRTRTLQKTLDPLFNETLTYHGITENDMKKKTLRLQVFDEDILKKNDFIGQTSVPLKSILLTNNRRVQKMLEPKSETEMIAVPSDGGRGRIQISLCYVSKANKLVVGVIRCSNLVAMDSNGYSDPYVKCYLLPDPSKKTKRRTKVKKHNLNPEYNEEFSYKIAHNELAARTLEITVWDYDVGKSNDFIGGIHFGMRSKDLLLKQWFETLKYRDKKTTYWHILTKDIALSEADE